MKLARVVVVTVTASSLAGAFAQTPCDSSGPIPFQDHGKWGYISPKGIVIPATFDSAGQFRDGSAIACWPDRCGIINAAGVLTAPMWNKHGPSLFEYSEGLAATVEGERWGYSDRAGNPVIPRHFEYAGPFHDGIAKVRANGKYFFIDKAGRRVSGEFDGVFEFHEGLAAVQVGDNIGYIRRDGSFALPPIHQSASGIDFSEGLVAVRINGKVGFMDKSGNIIIQPAYDDVYPFSDGLAPVQRQGKWGYVDKDGNLIVPIQYDMGHMFSEGFASVMLNGKGGYIDTTGKLVIPLQFDSVMPFCGGVAAVETFQQIPVTKVCHTALYKGKHGFIDHAGHYLWRDEEDQTWQSPFCF
jgi:hypothetical protein